MSAIAQSSSGEAKTAWEFRDEYLSSATKYESFLCPFCGVELHDRCIYAECKKAPHFSLPKGAKHAAHCGESEAVAVGPEKRIPTNELAQEVLKRDLELPEALIRPRTQRVQFPFDDGNRPVPINLREARRRATELTRAKLPQRYTTSMLREVATAYDRTIEAGLEIAAARRLGEKEKWALCDEVLDAHPLNLFGTELTYLSAFRNPKGGIHREKRIYQGRSGLVTLRSGQVAIEAREGVPVSRVDEGKAIDTLPLVVIVPVTVAGENARQARFRGQLSDAADSGRRVRWFAYGQPTKQVTEVVLRPEFLDDLYADLA